MLTSEQVAEYLRKKGVRCPYCGSDQIEGSSFDVQSEQAYQEMGCNACGESWQDAYDLVGVIDDEGQYKTGIADVWASDPNYPVEDWQSEVSNGDTRIGYWDWVENQREADRSEQTEDHDIYRCDRCKRVALTAEIPLHGYTHYLCRPCYDSMRAAGELP